MEATATATTTATTTAEATATIDKESGEFIPFPAKPTTLRQRRQYGDFSGDFNFHPSGIRALFTGENGVIRQAVDDAKTLIAAGVIKHGRLAVQAMPRKLCDGMTIAEVKDLLKFFEDRNLGFLLLLGKIDLPPKRFRERLDFEW